MKNIDMKNMVIKNIEVDNFFNMGMNKYKH